MTKQILLGTKNQARISIVKAALDPLPVELLTLKSLNITLDVKEDGRSTKENAEKKARAYFAACHIPTLSIDGSLHIERFPEDKQPGLFVRRIYGFEREVTDAELLAYYVAELNKVGGESMGTWTGSAVLVVSDTKVFSNTFTFKTLLTTVQRGKMASGAPLDKMMIDPDTGKYYTDIPWAERPDTEWIYEFVRQHLGDL
jgi:inosine/xanthosine triphosphate pyrophosphatase family protein